VRARSNVPRFVARVYLLAGWLVTPNLLTYFSGGYTQATFDRIDYTNLLGPPFGIPAGSTRTVKLIRAGSLELATSTR
jgi:hypothetical protein